MANKRINDIITNIRTKLYQKVATYCLEIISWTWFKQVMDQGSPGEKCSNDLKLQIKCF